MWKNPSRFFVKETSSSLKQPLVDQGGTSLCAGNTAVVSLEGRCVCVCMCVCVCVLGIVGGAPGGLLGKDSGKL